MVLGCNTPHTVPADAAAEACIQPEVAAEAPDNAVAPAVVAAAFHNPFLSSPPSPFPASQTPSAAVPPLLSFSPSPSAAFADIPSPFAAAVDADTQHHPSQIAPEPLPLPPFHSSHSQRTAHTQEHRPPPFPTLQAAAAAVAQTYPYTPA